MKTMNDIEATIKQAIGVAAADGPTLAEIFDNGGRWSGSVLFIPWTSAAYEKSGLTEQQEEVVRGLWDTWTGTGDELINTAKDLLA